MQCGLAFIALPFKSLPPHFPFKLKLPSTQPLSLTLTDTATFNTGIYPFAGKECARALALMSTEEKDCNGNLEGLGFTELDILRDWEAKFHIKYPVVGHVVAGK